MKPSAPELHDRNGPWWTGWLPVEWRIEMRSLRGGTGQAEAGVECQDVNVKRIARGDGWIVLLIAVFTLCAVIGLGAWAKSRPCEGMIERTGMAQTMCHEEGD